MLEQQQQAKHLSEDQVLAPLTQRERGTARNQLELGLRLPGEPLLSGAEVMRRNQARQRMMYPKPPEMSLAWSNSRWDRRTQKAVAWAWLAALLWSIAVWVYGLMH